MNRPLQGGPSGCTLPFKGLNSNSNHAAYLDVVGEKRLVPEVCDRLAPEGVSQVLLGLPRDVHRPRHARRLHVVGDGHVLRPDVVLPPVGVDSVWCFAGDRKTYKKQGAGGALPQLKVSPS